MPSLLRKPDTLGPSLWYPQYNPTYANLPRSIAARGDVPDCTNHKVQVIDFGPCGDPYMNWLSISLIFLVLVAVAFPMHKMRKRSRRTGSASVRIMRVWRTRHYQRNETQGAELQAYVAPQEVQDERRRRNITARPATDLSDQQTQLSQRLTELQVQLRSEQEHWDDEAAAGQNNPRTPDAAYVRDRVGEWEQYQIRSDGEVIARREPEGSTDQRTRSSTEESVSSGSWQADESPEPLPIYAAEDPLAAPRPAPIYTP
ncbi:MAG: hypothetical protein L6R39_004280 [Caloplaca ligustica]|nr:MAG: hypothetical protein L6R39_004280 [Caloplaca ligustica]